MRIYVLDFYNAISEVVMIMKRISVMSFILLTLAILTCLQHESPIGNAVLSSTFSGTALAQARPSKVIFKVKCYDDGKRALQGLKGIQKIETGFHYIHETDTVYFDPKAVTVEEMEAALKKAGTYVDTIREKERN